MTTTKATHTPGPWTFDEATGMVIAANGGVVKETPTDDEQISEEEAAANARLIAAAPELLDCLAEFAGPGWDEDTHTQPCASQPTWISGAAETGPCDCKYGRARTLMAFVAP